VTGNDFWRWYVMSHWPLTRWPWTFVVPVHQVSRDQYHRSLYEFDQNWTIPGWIIDNLANFVPVTAWCDLDLWPVDLEHVWYGVFNVYIKFKQILTTQHWVIDDFTMFETAFAIFQHRSPPSQSGVHLTESNLGTIYGVHLHLWHCFRFHLSSSISK